MPIFATILAMLSARWLRVAAGACLVAAAGGCAVGLHAGDHLTYDPALLTGERVFGEEVPPQPPLPTPMSAPSDAMRTYVQDVVSDTRLSSARFQQLYDRLVQDGYFKAVYSANSTLTAAEAFEVRGGNCLSYTNMFVALARAAGLDAHYQVVEVPPAWDADAGFLIRYTHINVLIRHIRMPHGDSGDLVVDFNSVLPDPVYPHRQVSDAYAESLYYANKAVALMRSDRPRKAFAHLRRAIAVDPDNADLWINLGAFYATQRAFEASLESYRVALQLDPHSRAALSGIARSYANAGDQKMAALYEEKVRHYRERNPYYHYALAQAAFASADYRRSLDDIDAAIALKRHVPRFHLLKGLIQLHLGLSDEAAKSMSRARQYGLHPSVKSDLLRALAGSGSS